ncbi:SUMF1/EgtB/PvdO family nonheme iron enzyme, partial [bacterium]|nr:SUMF1/EgtB/PvdO family nonheme iron enzyme [bacterium]
MVLIPPGEFLMGSTAQEQARFLEEAKAANDQWIVNLISIEGPQHRVRITRPFWLSRYEVTIGQFRQFADASDYKTDAERNGKGGSGVLDGQLVQAPQFVWNGDLGFPQTDSNPVIEVSWNDATACCQWLSQQQNGLIFRLPTEAEWEYACRAGTTSPYYSGESADDLRGYGWSTGNSGKQTHPVGQLKSNAFGLYDMHGNAWEWCADWYAADYYVASPFEDPRGPLTGRQRMFRGGSWYDPARHSRVAHRSTFVPDAAGNNLGFRL